MKVLIKPKSKHLLLFIVLKKVHGKTTGSWQCVVVVVFDSFNLLSEDGEHNLPINIYTNSKAPTCCLDRIPTAYPHVQNVTQRF